MEIGEDNYLIMENTETQYLFWRAIQPGRHLTRRAISLCDTHKVMAVVCQPLLIKPVRSNTPIYIEKYSGKPEFNKVFSWIP